MVNEMSTSLLRYTEKICCMRIWCINHLPRVLVSRYLEQTDNFSRYTYVGLAETHVTSAVLKCFALVHNCLKGLYFCSWYAAGNTELQEQRTPKRVNMSVNQLISNLCITHPRYIKSPLGRTKGDFFTTA